MGNKTKAGIDYFPLDVDHTGDRKIRLLLKDCGPTGYWIFMCILSEAYRTEGYFLDLSDEEELELFAETICDQELEVVQKTIEAAKKRRLFDDSIAADLGILTSVGMQRRYLVATKERRRKATVVPLREELLLIDPEELDEIAHRSAVEIVPRNNSINPRNNPQSKVKDSKGKESKVAEGSLVDKSTARPAEVIQDQIRKSYDEVVKTDANQILQILKQRPTFLEPYVDYWNIFAKKYGFPEVQSLSPERRRKIRVRAGEPTFEFPHLLILARDSTFIREGTFFSFDWLTGGATNYVKLSEGNYSKDPTTPTTSHNAIEKQQSGELSGMAQFAKRETAQREPSRGE